MYENITPHAVVSDLRSSLLFHFKALTDRFYPKKHTPEEISDGINPSLTSIGGVIKETVVPPNKDSEVR